RQHFAADVLRTGFRIGKHAAGRRDDGDAEAVADGREFLGTRIDPAAGLGDAGDVLDRRFALEVLQFDPQRGVLAGRVLAVATDVAFTLEHFEHVRTQLG